MSLRTPKRIQSDINRVVAQKAVVIANPMFNGQAEKDLISVYNAQIKRYQLELDNTATKLSTLKNIQVNDAIILTTND